jgi:Tfp pilus assembly protein PilF
MLRNDLPKARTILEHAVKAMPDHIGTWHALAWTELLMGDVNAAEKSYQSAYDLDRNFADSHGGLALIAALRGNTEKADHSVKLALKLNPQCPTALYAKSILLTDAGKTEEAEQLMTGLMAGTPLPANASIAEFARNLRARFNTAPQG